MKTHDKSVKKRMKKSKLLCDNRSRQTPQTVFSHSLWPPCVADTDIIFLYCFYLSSFFPRLISAVADWMSTILTHIVWP